MYHLITDPGEKENLIEQLDNLVYREICENLLSELQKWYLSYADPAVDGSREAVTGFGQLRRPGAYSEGKSVYADIPKSGT